MPFEMVNDRLLDMEHMKPFKLLIFPNIATLSDEQCSQVTDFVREGGSILTTFETSLYDENGKRRNDFGLKDLLGVSYNGGIEGPMQNSYLRLKADPSTGKYHSVLRNLEDAYRIINFTHRVKVKPVSDFPAPVTLIPTYPDLPMEHVYPLVTDSGIRELYLKDNGKGRIAYFPGDIDRSFWQIMCVDHGTLLRNTIRWALNEEPIVSVQGPGILDVTVWRQKSSLTVFLVNLTNPMMMKGPIREFIPVDAHVSIKIPDSLRIKGAHLLVSNKVLNFEMKGNTLSANVPQIQDYEIIGLDTEV
jgi:hypothetical protein